MLCDFSPTRSIFDEEFNDEQVFLQVPLSLDNVWAEMVMPTLTALFPDASLEAVRDLSPVLRTLLSHKLGKEFIFLLRPVGLRNIILSTEL